MPDTHALPGIVQPRVSAMDRAEEITPNGSRANGLTAKPTPEEITPAEAMRLAEIRLIQSEIADASHGEASASSPGRSSCSPRSRVAANRSDQGAAGEAQKLTDDPAVTEALRLAEIRLMQSEDCRLGYLRDSFVSDACGYLRAAGLGELADRLEDDPWGGGAGEIFS